MSDQYTSIHEDYLTALDLCFDRLQKFDRELCERLMAAFGNRHTAVVWLMTHKLESNVPITLLTADRRREVLESLLRIEHCVY